MQPFVFHAPTRILFGEHTAGSARDVVKEFGGEKTLIITDANLINSGLLAPIMHAFGDLPEAAAPVVFDAVPPDSDVRCVHEATETARKAGCDSIIAVGGGSVLDTAKVVNICLTLGGELLEYQGLNNLPRPLLPLVAVPTTAGTGSEVSLVAMIKDVEEGKKLLFGSPYLAARAAILDPGLTLSLPPRLTAATGFDALTHDIESFVALAAGSPFTDPVTIESMKLLFRNLLRATRNGGDLEARAATLVASTMAGVAFTNTGVGIVHALAHAVGARFNTHHGMTNAVFLPHGMEYNLEAALPRFALAARLAEISDAADDEEASRNLVASVRQLMADCGLPARLRDLGVPELSEAEQEELAFHAYTDPAIMFNPRESSVEDIMGILKRAY